MIRQSKLAHIAFVLLLTGCAAGQRQVLFITKTSLGVDFDTAPPGLSVAYDRKEGYFGPRYANGAVPPVLAQIKSGGGVLSTQAKQLFATGAAAHMAVGGDAKPSSPELKGKKKIMFFGTSTTVGLKTDFNTVGVPSSFVVGFKRKEASYIQLDKNDEGNDTYPSTIAMLDTTAKADKDKKGGLDSSQFFATGVVAEELASKPQLKDLFTGEALNSLQAYRKEAQTQEAEAARVLRCYMGIHPQFLPELWQNAVELSLFSEAGMQDKLLGWHAEATAAEASSQVCEDRLRKAGKRYASEIYGSRGYDQSRAKLLEAHRKRACALSKKSTKLGQAN
ncbi:hypothetical protein ACFL2T_05685 [Elusimicrobiota bacterium]